MCSMLYIWFGGSVFYIFFFFPKLLLSLCFSLWILIILLMLMVLILSLIFIPSIYLMHVMRRHNMTCL